MKISQVLAKHFGDDNSDISFTDDDYAGISYQHTEGGGVDLTIYDNQYLRIWRKEFTNPERLDNFLTELLSENS